MLCYTTLRYPDPFIICIITRKHVDVHGVEGVYWKKYGYDRMDIKQLRLRFSLSSTTKRDGDNCNDHDDIARNGPIAWQHQLLCLRWLALT